MAFTLPAPVLLGIRAFQAIFAIIVLGTMARVSSFFRGYYYIGYSTPSQVAFLIFVAVWTLLALIALVVVPMKLGTEKSSHRIGVLVLEVITMIFWFAGFIASAVAFTGCSNYYVGTDGICSNGVAGTVFAAFEWLLFAVTTAFAALLFVGHSGAGPKVHSTGPAVTVQEGV